jgi:hypothetical protein
MMNKVKKASNSTMELSPSQEAANCPGTQEFAMFYGI